MTQGSNAALPLISIRVPFGFRRGEQGKLVAHEIEQKAIGEMLALSEQRKSLRKISDVMKAKGFQISYEGVANVLKTHQDLRRLISK